MLFHYFFALMLSCSLPSWGKEAPPSGNTPTDNTTVMPAKQEQKTVLLAILAQNKAHVLPSFLQCIDSLDYDKQQITVYINSSGNKDNTEEILQSWAQTNKQHYQQIVFDNHEIKNTADIRQNSLNKTKEYGCDYYFVVDCDVFLTPSTLKELVSKDKPIIAPMVRAIPHLEDVFCNYFCDTDANGYFKDHPKYYKILYKNMSGTFKVPVISKVYLVNSCAINELSYLGKLNEWEFIVFSRSARQNNIEQYICNEQNFGTFLHFPQDSSLEEESSAFQQLFDNHPNLDITDLKSFDPLEGRIAPSDKRYHTFKRALALMEERKVKTIVETGTARDGANNFEGDGGSTVIFSHWASQHNGSLHSVDIDQLALNSAAAATSLFQDHVTLTNDDSVHFLQNFPKTIDFLYLDSFDFDYNDPYPSQQHHLKEIEAAYDKLSLQCIVMIDDCQLPYGGKGKEVISFLQKRGWEIIEDNYQVILTNASDKLKTQLSVLENAVNNGKNSDAAYPSLLQIAQLKEKLGYHPDNVIKAYNRAFHYSLKKEPLYHLSCYYRRLERYEEGYQTALEGLKLGTDDYSMLMEFSLCAWKIGNYDEALDASHRLLVNPHVPQADKLQLQRNLSHFQAIVQIEKDARTSWGAPPWEKRGIAASARSLPPFSTPEKSALHICTVATYDCDHLSQLIHSCKIHDITLEFLGAGTPTPVENKIKFFQDYLENVPDEDVVLFLETYDTILLADEQTILNKFHSFNAPLVFSAETQCYPFPQHISHYPAARRTKFKFLNSGSYIGYARNIKQMLKELSSLSYQTDNQGLFSMYYLYHPEKIKLDNSCALFVPTCTLKKEDFEIHSQNKNVQCLSTASSPCILHSNREGKVLYQHLYDTIFSNIGGDQLCAHD